MIEQVRGILEAGGGQIELFAVVVLLVGVIWALFKYGQAVKDYLATLDDAAFGAASEKQPKFVSPSDPAAQWTGALRGPAFFTYATNYLIDTDNAVIVDVEGTRAIRQSRWTSADD